MRGVAVAEWREEIIGDARLILGDCLQVLPTLGKVDCVVTDPPYGVNLGNHAGSKDYRAGVLVKLGYDSYDDTPENFVKIVVPAIKQALALADRGAVFISGKSAWMLPAPDSIGGIFLPAGMGRNGWGFASLQHILLYGKAPDLHKGSKATAIRSSDVSEKNGHPCPKPLRWMKWLINLSSRHDETILDPFMGSGTTGVACAKLGRKFIGIELEPKYFDIACERIQKAYDQPDLFIPQPKKAEQIGLL